MARLSDKFSQHAKKLETVSGVVEKAATSLLPEAKPDVLTELSLTSIEPDPDQPRRELGDLTELAASIKELGVVQPIVVSVMEYDRYLILAGERRFSAAKLAGLEKIPAIVRSVEEHARIQLQIVENLHRKDLTPFEEAWAYQTLSDQFGFKQEDIARRLGRSQESVSEILRLLDLVPTIQEGYEEANRETGGRITRSLLLEIARRPKPEQTVLWEQAKRGELTVKKVRAVRQAMADNAVSPSSGEANPNGSRIGPLGKAHEMRFRYPIHLEGVIVVLQFEQAKATSEDIIEVLELALASEKERFATSR